MIIETERLILRPWKETDAESLYKYASNPLVSLMTGWATHTSVEYSLGIIKTVLSERDNYAVAIKEEDVAIGGIGLMFSRNSNLKIAADEAEIGFWLGIPYWGRGIIPEAVRALVKYAFTELNVSKIWCGYFDGNEKSKRVGEKCGFAFHHTEYGKEYPLINAVKTQHITCLTRQRWTAALK